MVVLKESLKAKVEVKLILNFLYLFFKTKDVCILKAS